jgi:hypothetical protein
MPPDIYRTCIYSQAKRTKLHACSVSASGYHSVVLRLFFFIFLLHSVGMQSLAAQRTQGCSIPLRVVPMLLSAQEISFITLCETHSPAIRRKGNPCCSSSMAVLILSRLQLHNAISYPIPPSHQSSAEKYLFVLFFNCVALSSGGTIV